MATHSSILAWRIPGLAEPGGLPSVGGTESDTTEATQKQQQQRGVCGGGAGGVQEEPACLSVSFRRDQGDLGFPTFHWT